MKKILFVTTSLGCGGINRALESLIIALKEDLDIYVYALNPEGQYSSGFDGARLLKSNFFVNITTRVLSKQKGLAKISTLIFKLLDRISGRKLTAYFNFKTKNKLDQQGYDAVIAFSEGLPTHFVAEMNVKNKLAWIHCDYKSYLQFSSTPFETEKANYEKYDHIVCVSKYTKDSFKDVCPEVRDRTLALTNILDTNKMIEDSYAFEAGYEDGFNIVTVGRIDPVKHQSVIPKILHYVNKKYNNVNWYIIGPNNSPEEHSKLIDNVRKYGVEKNIFLLGEKDNPYPYIRQANLLVNTSVSEACPYVVNEAKILGTPVVCTNFGSANEFIQNGFNGFFVPVEEMHNTIINLIENQSLYSQIKNNLRDFVYDNEFIKKSILQLIEK